MNPMMESHTENGGVIKIKWKPHSPQVESLGISDNMCSLPIFSFWPYDFFSQARAKAQQEAEAALTKIQKAATASAALEALLGLRNLLEEPTNPAMYDQLSEELRQTVAMSRVGLQAAQHEAKQTSKEQIRCLTARVEEAMLVLAQAQTAAAAKEVVFPPAIEAFLLIFFLRFNMWLIWRSSTTQPSAWKRSCSRNSERILPVPRSGQPPSWWPGSVGWKTANSSPSSRRCGPVGWMAKKSS
jgi:hypothetical protein